MAPTSPRPRLSHMTSTMRQSLTCLGETFAFFDSIVATSRISFLFHDSTTIVPDMFRSSTRTFLPPGYRFDICCWALTATAVESEISVRTVPNVRKQVRTGPHHDINLRLISVGRL